MSNYVEISHQEMRDFLGVGFNDKPLPDSPWKFYKLDLDGVYEEVYGWRVKENITLRIYTSISHGISREKGKDAIRCILFFKDHTGKITLCGSEKKVLRVKGWKKNLAQRIENWQEFLGPTCPACQSPMVKRKNNKSKSFFYGCCMYPVCNESISI